MSIENAPVIFAELSTESAFKIGHATLSKSIALNALDLNMINLLIPQLEKWQQDPNIAMVLLDGSGDKAFCAGGDVVSMHQSMLLAQQSTQSDYSSKSLQAFFTREYQLDYLIHTYTKPILVWGNGIVMGGGLGLMSGASHKVVTESSRIAMPEISIGLYPDVGGSYFLNKMPEGCGLFLGLTGASINATDALYTKLADYYVPHDAKATLLARLMAANWQAASLHNTVNSICGEFHSLHCGQLPQGQLKAQQSWLAELAAKTDVKQAVDYILAAQADDNKWLSKAQKTLKSGSPISAHLVFEQLRQGQHKTLAECFQMELGLSCQCGEYGEFQEGVRALLIDKDNQPNWRFKTVSDVPKDTLNFFFAPLWSHENHPLKMLAVDGKQ